MAIPNNIERPHLLTAIKKIDREGVPERAQSKYYDVEYEQKRYPPKLIVSYANIYANGVALDRDSFEGGKDTPCFKLLQSKGFTIVEKEDFFVIVLDFLSRVLHDPDNFTTKDFKGTFKGLKVEVSFGKGNQAAIPWIALLAEGQQVTKGIYPVYLYFKRLNRLLLAFGVSETNSPDKNWSVSQVAIRQFLDDQWDNKQDRYGDSLVYTDYQVKPQEANFGLNKQEIDKDIRAIIGIYKQTMEATIKPPVKKEIVEKQIEATFDYRVWVDAMSEAQLEMPRQLALRLAVALATKPFVILTGLSGSGKTKLALAFAKWIAAEDAQVCVVPVGADWTNREPLLGFPNMQEKKAYVFPENGVLHTILAANQDPQKPYFLILDEMNLSHVERYFADFLSCMESGEPICLHPGKETWNDGVVPDKIKLPPNLFIIGTVNVDETTYMFSPKVLDRASVIEFKIEASMMKRFLERNTLVDMSLLEKKGRNMAASYVQLAQNKKTLHPNKQLTDELMRFFEALKGVGAEFGYRTASEILQFAEVAKIVDATWNDNDIMDAVVMQKLLPRLHGARRKLEAVLEVLAGFCSNDDSQVAHYLKKTTQLAVEEGIKYPLALDKIKRMYQGLMDIGFTSYAEA